MTAEGRRFRPGFAPTFAAIAGLALLVSLGNWQMRRADEKLARQALFDARQTVMLALPVKKVDAEQYEWARISARGEFVAAKTVLLDNKVAHGRAGYQVVTPLRLEGGQIALLVNRGWIGETEVDRVLPELLAQPTGTVEGLARYPILPPGQELSPGRWTRLDAEEMGKTLPYPVVAWHLAQGRREVPADERNMGTFPVQRYQVQRDDIPHMDYMLTWYGLAGALTATVVIRIRSQRARTTGATAASIP